jgi:hypothetical protein
MRRWVQAKLLHRCVEGDMAQRGKRDEVLQALSVVLFDLCSDLEQFLLLFPREWVGLPLRKQGVPTPWRGCRHARRLCH